MPHDQALDVSDLEKPPAINLLENPYVKLRRYDEFHIEKKKIQKIYVLWIHFIRGGSRKYLLLKKSNGFLIFF